MHCNNPGSVPDMEQVLQQAEQNDWKQLVAAIRDIMSGKREESILLGLDDEDRVAIVVLPPNTWTFARGTRAGSAIGVEENVVSVRYGDVREHLNGRIDYEEFARRADIRTRLGLATPTAPDPEQN